MAEEGAEGPRTRPKNEKGVGELANCYGASPGALRRDSTTLGGLAKGAGELGRGG